MSPPPADRLTLSVPAEFYERIGRVINQWALLENAIDIVVWQLANVEPDAGACITSHLQSLNRKLQTLISLVRLRGGSQDLASRLNKFLATTDKLARQRNRIVHDPWVYGKRTSYQVEITAEKRPVFQLTQKSLEDLEGTEQDIWAMHVSLKLHLLPEIEILIETWREKQP